MSAVSESATTTSGSRTSSRRSRCGRSRGSDRSHPINQYPATRRPDSLIGPAGGGTGHRRGGQRPSAMYVAALTLDVLLGDVHSLKQKRGIVRPLVAELRRRFPGVAVAETGHLDLHRRAEIGVAVVSATAGNASQLLDECERIVASHPEIELLSARQRLYNEEE